MDAERLREERLKRMRVDHLDYKMKRELRRKALVAKEALEEECFRIKLSLLESDGTATNATNVKSIIEECDRVLQWIQDNPNESHVAYQSSLTMLKSMVVKFK